MRSDIPSDMKAAVLNEFGGPDVLHTESIPIPNLGPRDVLLRIDTAGIGVWDPWVREGGFDDGKTKFPYVMGNDGGGEVVAVGSEVTRVSVGDRAYGYQMQGGFYAEYAKVNERHLARVPKRVDPRAAGALGADGITGLRGLDGELRLKPGQSVMIIGASGGIGHLAAQLAKRMGARVLAVASHEDGVKLAQRLGADEVIDGHKTDIAEAAKRFEPEGLDAALVLAGGKDVNAALKALKNGGRVAWPNGVEPEPKAPEGVHGLPYDGTPSAEAFDRLNELIGDDEFHIELGRTYSLDEVAKAHEELKEHHLGKYAIRVH